MWMNGENADYFFWWFVTRRCNNRCRHCLRLGIGDLGEELDAAQAKRLLCEFAAVRRLAAEHGITRVMPGRLILEGGGKACAELALTDDEWERFLAENEIEMPSFHKKGPPRLPHGHFVIMAGGEFRPNRRGPALGHWPEDSIATLLARLPPAQGA